MSRKVEILNTRKITVITVRELKEALNKLLNSRRIIEGNDGEIHYQFTKEISSDGYEFFVFRVSGSSEDNRQGLIAQISSLLGKPVKEFPAEVHYDYDSIFWYAPEIKEAVT